MVNDKDVYKEYVALSEKMMLEGSLTKDNLLEELYDISLIYEPFIKYCDRYSQTTNDLMQELRDMNQSTAYPFLMRVFLDRKNRPDKVTEETLDKVINLIIVYLVRRIICGVPSNSLRGFMLSLYRRVFKIEDNYDRYYEAIYAYLKSIRSNDYLRALSEVEDDLENAPIYNNLKFATYLLFKLENGRYPNVYTETVTTKSPTVEHIMPQALTDAWNRMLNTEEDDPEEVHRQYLNTLGNLSLSSRAKNSVMSNEEFDFKKSILKTDGSKFEVLNKDIISADKFTKTEILARCGRLSSLVLEKYGLDEVDIEGIKFEENIEVIATVEANNIFIGAQPLSYKIFDKEFAVDSYAKIVVGVAQQLLELYPDRMRELAAENYNPWNDSEDARACIHFKDDSLKDICIGDGIYVNTTYQANYSVQFCVYMMQECDIEADDLQIFLKKSSIKKENTISKKERISMVRQALNELRDEGYILYDPETMPPSDDWIKFQTTKIRELFKYEGDPITWDGKDTRNQVCFLEYNMGRHRVIITLKLVNGVREYIDKIENNKEILAIDQESMSGFWHLKIYSVDYKKVANAEDVLGELKSQILSIVNDINQWCDSAYEVII